MRTLLGKPWKPNARGPEAFDCWGLVWWVYREVAGIELPKFVGIDAKDTYRVAKQMHESSVMPPWYQVEHPQHLDVVGMSSNRIIHHVGLYLQADRGLIFHVAAGGSVIAQSAPHLFATGTQTIRFYRHEQLRTRN